MNIPNNRPKTVPRKNCTIGSQVIDSLFCDSFITLLTSKDIHFFSLYLSPPFTINRRMIQVKPLTSQQLHNRVMEREEKSYRHVGHKVPFAESVFLARNKAYATPSLVQGRRLRSTFLSGGCLYTNQSQHFDSMVHKAADIARGVILTDVDIAYCDEGIRVHFELDYRTSSGPFPTKECFQTHLDLIHKAVCDCYPQEKNLTMWVATCQEKRKFSRSNLTEPKLAWGAHVVFPCLLATTDTLRRIAQVIDTRLTNLSDGWEDVVDTSSYRAESATLRPCYSYKSGPCLRCKADPELIESSFDVPCDCQHGRRLDPSIYTFWGIVPSSGEVQAPPTVEETLRQMTIVAPVGSQVTAKFHLTPDMMKESSVAVTTKKKRKTSAPRKTTVINAHDAPDGHKILRVIIGRFHTDYAHVALDRVHVDKNKVMTICVKGRGCHTCPYVGRDHTSNRVYFVLHLRQSTISIKCYSRQCRAVPTLVTKSLTQVEKYELVQGFGMETGAYHKKSSKPVPAPAPAPAVDKKTVWEERMLTFLKETTGKGKERSR